MTSRTLPKIRRVAIIGGGPMGVCTAKYLHAEGCFDQIDVFEQTTTVEGVWAYSQPDPGEQTPIPQTSPFAAPEEPDLRLTDDGPKQLRVTTPMYRDLESNLPLPLVTFSDQSFPPHTQLFPSRKEVSLYVERYARDVRHLIQFETQVEEVRLASVSPDRWLMRIRNLRTAQQRTEEYDAVAICNGHFTVPFLPDIVGVESWNRAYPGRISHSKLFRYPEPFRDQKVLIIGASASGIDIAAHISEVCTQPVIISTRSDPFMPIDGKGSVIKNARSMGAAVEFINPAEASRAVRFADGQIEENIDNVLFSTGYLYSYPFLRGIPDLITNGQSVHHLYQHIFHIEHPSLAFVMLPTRVLPFPLSETQCAAIARVFSGRLALPSKHDMYAWEQKAIEETAGSPRLHNMGYPREFEYQDSLDDWISTASGSQGKASRRMNAQERWLRQQIAAVRKAFVDQGNARSQITNVQDLGFSYEAWLTEQAASDPLSGQVAA